MIIFIFTIGYSKGGFKIGVGAGLNVCKIKERNYSDRNSSMIGYDVAIPMEIKVAKYFAIQPEIHFIQKGFSLSSYMIDVSTEYRKRNFIEFPILFKALFTIKEKNTLSFFTGVGVGYAMANVQFLKYIDGHKKRNKLPFDTNIDDDGIAYNKLDITVPVGFGYEYKINDKLALYTDLRWNLDVNNNIKYKVKPSPEPYYKYRNFIFSVGLFYIAKSRD